MISATTTAVVGDYGIVSITTDGGNHWAKSQLTSSPFNAVYFVDSLYGMVAGDLGTIYKTTNGGATWTKLKGDSLGRKINSVILINKKIGFVAGDGSTLLMTTDSGRTWSPHGELPIVNIKSLRMLRPDFIAMVGDQGGIAITRDTMQSFQLVKTVVQNTVYDIAFADETHATAIGEGGVVWGTTNGGSSWIKEDSNQFNVKGTLNCIDSKDKMRYITVGDYGTILYTTDGGVNWTASSIGALPSIKGVSCLNPDVAIAVGANGIIIKTTNGGVDWDFLPRQPQTAGLRTIKMYENGRVGVAAGNFGSILRSIDSGTTWFPVPTGRSENLLASAYSLNGVGYIVGELGIILSTKDSGASWTKMNSPATEQLNAISFPTPNVVYIFGNHGTFLKSVDGGNDWVKFKSPAPDTESVFACSFADSLYGLVCAQSGIYKTIDAGVTWRLVSPSGDYIMNAISIGSSRMHAYASGISTLPGPAISYTTDGGESWKSNTYTQPNLPYNIYSWDGHHATVVGKTGSIFHITDNMATWAQQYTPTSSNLFGISFGTIKAGYACGFGGTILRIDTDEEADVRNPTASTLDALKIERVYPNPAVRRVRVTISSSENGPASASLYDLLGSRVGIFDLGFLEEGEHTTDLNLPILASGSYILTVQCAGASATTTIVIEH
jgi:photosystem II stability/assembly factor-like uncharacterized protein